MQLDIFEHSRDVMLRNDVLDALDRRGPGAARSALQALAAEYATDNALAALDRLVRALEEGAETPPFADHAAARAARVAIEQEIEPAALALWDDAAARAWLAPLWRDLAMRAARLAFRADASEDHAAPPWLRSGDWQAAAHAVARIESWRRIPAPLAWMAEARCRIDGAEAAWPLLAELAWLAPQRFDSLERRLRDAPLAALRRKFDAEFEGGDGGVADLAWLPAWAPIEKPALARLLAEVQPARGTPPEQAMRVVLELLRLERGGRHREMIERRKVLRDISPWLYAAYMKTR